MFEPCSEYVRIEDSCATCIHSCDEPTCAALVALFREEEE